MISNVSFLAFMCSCGLSPRNNVMVLASKTMSKIAKTYPRQSNKFLGCSVSDRFIYAVSVREGFFPPVNVTSETTGAPKVTPPPTLAGVISVPLPNLTGTALPLLGSDSAPARSTG